MEHAKQPTLAQLIERYKGDRSYEKLAEASGGTVSIPRFHSYATAALSLAPGPDKLRGVARALGLDEHTIWMAVGASLGIHTQPTPIALDGLPADVAQSIATLVSTLKSRYDGA